MPMKKLTKTKKFKVEITRLVSSTRVFEVAAVRRKEAVDGAWKAASDYDWAGSGDATYHVVTVVEV